MVTGRENVLFAPTIAWVFSETLSLKLAIAAFVILGLAACEGVLS